MNKNINKSLKGAFAALGLAAGLGFSTTAYAEGSIMDYDLQIIVRKLNGDPIETVKQACKKNDLCLFDFDNVPETQGKKLQIHVTWHPVTQDLKIGEIAARPHISSSRYRFNGGGYFTTDEEGQMLFPVYNDEKEKLVEFEMKLEDFEGENKSSGFLKKIFG